LFEFLLGVLFGADGVIPHSGGAGDLRQVAQRFAGSAELFDQAQEGRRTDAPGPDQAQPVKLVLSVSGRGAGRRGIIGLRHAGSLSFCG